MDPNKEVFDFAKELLNSTMVERFGDSTEDIRKELTRFIDGYDRQFPQELIRHHFNKDGDRSFTGRYEGAVPWRPLDPIYQARKSRQGYSLNYYERTGGLKQSIARMSHRKGLGKSKVQVTIGDKKQSSRIKINSAGRPFWTAGSGGRGFASTQDTLRELSVSLPIDMFPLAQGKTAEAIIPQLVSNWSAFKWLKAEGFSPAKGQSARPMLIPFLRWYTTKNLRNALQRKFGVDLS